MTQRERDFYANSKLRRQYFAKLIEVPQEAITDYFNGKLSIHKNREEYIKIDIAVNLIEDLYLEFTSTKFSDYADCHISMNVWKAWLDLDKEHFHKLYDRLLMIEL